MKYATRDLGERNLFHVSHDDMMSDEILLPTASVTTAPKPRNGDGLMTAVFLEQLTEGSWRVCDTRVSAARAGRVLAFVEARGAVFDVLNQPNDEFRWRGFPTMRAAVAFIVETNAEVPAARTDALPSRHLLGVRRGIDR